MGGPSRRAVISLIVIWAGSHACHRPGSDSNQSVLRVSVPRPLKGWDLARSVEFEEDHAQALVFEGLTLASSAGLLSGLAERWTSSDGQEFVFHLRREVRFHDGTRFSAGDVIRAWQEALRRPGSSHPWPLDPILGALEFSAGEADSIRGLRASDDSTLRIELVRPFAAFPATIAHRMLAVPARASSDSVPIGTGPWRFVDQSADGYRFAKHAEYWGHRPVLDTLVLRIVANSELAREFEAGRLDCAEDVNYRVRRSLLARTDLLTSTSAPVGLRQLAFNFRNPDLRDHRVRRAMQLAIDVDRLARETGNENTIPAAGMIPPGYSGHDSTLAAWPYDPTEAKRLLAEARFRPARPIRLWTTTASQRDSLRSVSYRLRDYLRAVGVPIEMYISDGDWSVMTDGIVDLNSETTYPRYADGDDMLYHRYHSAVQSGAGNEGAFADRRVDSLLDRSRATVDSAARSALLREANRAVFHAGAVLMIWYAPLTSVYSPRITGCPAGAFPSTFTDVRLAHSGSSGAGQ
jgi:peptide/nickel transport system substrate-binding protein